MQWIGTEHYREHLVTLCEFYRGRRDAFESALQTHFSDLATWNSPQGGLFFWLTLKQPLDTRIEIETPEGIDMLLRPAGLVSRALAFGIDFAIRAALLGV
ncbi:aminotransferase, class I and II, partial [Pseudomonas syringae pv. japonica str. M301072]